MRDPADRADNVLRFDRHFDGAPEMVFALFTRPELVPIWEAASHGFRAEVLELDARPGGIWRYRNRKGDTVEHPWGVYHEVVPGRRLAWSYFYEGTDFRSFVSIDLAPEGQGTRMQFCQSGFPDAVSLAEHGKGWPVVWRLFQDVLLAGHGIGAHLPSIPERPMDGVARDLEAARQRWEAEREAAE